MDSKIKDTISVSRNGSFGSWVFFYPQNKNKETQHGTHEFRHERKAIPAAPLVADRFAAPAAGDIRIMIYGSEGVGKSTFAASAPKPIFIQTEDGLSEIDTSKFPLCTTFDEVVLQLQAVRDEEHDYATVVIDSLDWLERLIWDRVCADYGVTTSSSRSRTRSFTRASWTTIHRSSFFIWRCTIRSHPKERSMYSLRPYQQEAVDAVYRHLRERDTNPCVVIPTCTEERSS